MRAAGTSHVADTAADGGAATTRTQPIAPTVAAASGGLSGRAVRDFRRFVEAVKNGARMRLAWVGSMVAVGRPQRLWGGAGRPGPGQVVGWGHGGADGGGSGGCWEPRCASARVFLCVVQLVPCATRHI
jgi:hypothetical protein